METEKKRILADRAAIQIKSWPVVTGKDKCKRLVKKLAGQKQAPVDSFSWPNAMLGEGLLAAYEATGNIRYLHEVKEYLKRWKTAGYRVHYVDNIMNGQLALWMEQLLQEEKNAASFGRQSPKLSPEEKEEIVSLCKEAENACDVWLKTAPGTDGGMLRYRNQHPDWIFADTIGMTAPFLCRFGARLIRQQDAADRERGEQLLRLGISQLEDFLKKGMDQRTGLLYHGYDEKTGMKYGIIGWGRACGWILKGLAESLPWIPKEWDAYEKIRTAFYRLVEAVSEYQRPDGGFSWLLEAGEGHRDRSAEGMIGAALACAVRCGLLEAQDCMEPEERKETIKIRETALEIVSRLEESLGKLSEAELVKGTSGECKGFGEYPQVYGEYPWGTGSVLEFLSLQDILNG